jgi:VanZ family protein
LVAAVIVLSLVPQPPVSGVAGSDKLGHTLSYWLLMVWFTQLYPRPRYGLLALAFIALGLMLELLQALMPPRSFDLVDIAANTGGVLLGWVLAVVVRMEWLRWLDRYAAGWLRRFREQ